jgi:hypothetical protein
MSQAYTDAVRDHTAALQAVSDALCAAGRAASKAIDIENLHSATASAFEELHEFDNVHCGFGRRASQGRASKTEAD